MSAEKIRILLVDDHALFRSGLRSLLERSDDFTVVGEAKDGLEGLKRARSLEPDVVLLDLHMPGISGLEALKGIVEALPDSKVLMLTVSEDTEDLMEALRSGASGYLLKNIEMNALNDAIRRTAQGESVLAESMTQKLVNNVRQKAQENTLHAEPEHFSPRECDILKGLAQGDSNKKIARTLNLAESTVKIHVQNIFKKLKVSNRVQVALYAVEHGYAEKENAAENE